MSHRINTPVYPVEGVGLRTFRDSPPRDALITQLIERNYATLGRRPVCDSPL